MTTARITRADAAWQTRQNIVAEAHKAFAEHGLVPVSVQNIADRAGISRPGLLKHFASKDELIAAVAVAFDEETSLLMQETSLDRPAESVFSAHVDGYAVLSAVLLSRAMIDGRSSMAVQSHHQRLMSSWADSSALDHTTVSSLGRAKVAVWEGLQVMSNYLPEVDPAAYFAGRGSGAEVAGTQQARSRPEPLALDTVLTNREGYAPGRRRRQQIISDATALFAENGFGGTTMQEISSRVNVATSTLLHHFPSKTQLFAEVMKQRDIGMVVRRAGALINPAEEILSAGAEASRDAESESGLITLYAVLSTEAVRPEHPVHFYFRDRYVRTVAYFENLFARAASDLELDLNARFEAVWLVALWDGLQYQSILESGRTDLDLPRMLDWHTNRILGKT